MGLGAGILFVMLMQGLPESFIPHKELSEVMFPLSFSQRPVIEPGCNHDGDDQASQYPDEQGLAPTKASG